jgi:hypothetical protein
MVTSSLSSSTTTTSNSSNDDSKEETATTTMTTTREPTTGKQATASSNHSSSDWLGDDSAEDTVNASVWESAIEKLLETPISSSSSSSSSSTAGAKTATGTWATKCGQESEGRNDSNATCLRHVRQLDSWDCGVACLLMVWEWQSHHHMMIIQHHNHHQQRTACQDLDDSDDDYRQREAVRRAWILQKIATRSVWTADLVYILDLILQRTTTTTTTPRQLQQSKVNILFCSNILQVNESLHGIEYYTKNFEQDRNRVRHRFDVIRERRIPLWQHPLHVAKPSGNRATGRNGGGGLPLAQVVRLIEHPNCIAIVLVDNAILTFGGQVAPVANQQPTTPAAAAAVPYRGHFIILAGTSRDAKHLKQACTASSTTSTGGSGDDDVVVDDYCFVAYDPGVHDSISYICPKLLERAWRAEGTDEDIIFLYKTARTAAVPS